jgi:hypothetical protein
MLQLRNCSDRCMLLGAIVNKQMDRAKDKWGNESHDR